MAKSCPRIESCAGFVFESQELAYAELALEFLHVLVHSKAHELARIGEFLFELVFQINGFAIPGDISLRSLECTCKGALPSNAAGLFPAQHLSTFISFLFVSSARSLSLGGSNAIIDGIQS